MTVCREYRDGQGKRSKERGRGERKNEEYTVVWRLGWTVTACLDIFLQITMLMSQHEHCYQQWIRSPELLLTMGQWSSALYHIPCNRQCHQVITWHALRGQCRVHAVCLEHCVDLSTATITKTRSTTACWIITVWTVDSASSPLCSCETKVCI